MKKVFCFVGLLLTLAGCSQQQNDPRIGQIQTPEKENLFNTQLIQFLSIASELNTATQIGTSKEELHDLFLESKGQFDLVQELWPSNFCSSGKLDLQKAVEGWAMVNRTDLKVISDSTNATPASNLLYSELLAYTSQAPTGERLNLIYSTNDFDMRCVRLDDEEGPENNNSPLVLSIASMYFQRGRSGVIEQIQN